MSTKMIVGLLSAALAFASATPAGNGSRGKSETTFRAAQYCVPHPEDPIAPRIYC